MPCSETHLVLFPVFDELGLVMPVAPRDVGEDGPSALSVEMQPPGDGTRPHPLDREGPHLRPPQIRRRLRRLQDPRQPPALRERQVSNIQTHVNLLWLSRLSVLDTKCV